MVRREILLSSGKPKRVMASRTSALSDDDESVSHSLRSRVNKNGVLLLKGQRMTNLKNRNSVPQLASNVRAEIDRAAVDFVIEMTAAAVGAMVGDNPKSVTLNRKNLYMVMRDRGISALNENTRARVSSKKKTRRE